MKQAQPAGRCARLLRAAHGAFASVLAVSTIATSQAGAQSVIRHDGTSAQLLVDARPFIVLGGEAYNSSASNPPYMAQVWDRVQAAGANTMLAPMEWDQLEPQEGKFDFTVADSLVDAARRHGMRLVVLWFGAFKNARSTYAPGWVRADHARFPRAVTATPASPTGAFATTLAPVLSVFSAALLAADEKAFAALLAHIAAHDVSHRVILVQVENETGLLGDSRDRSAVADAAWAAPVPPQLLGYLADHQTTLSPELGRLWAAQDRPRAGSWARLFGSGPRAQEAFMAWNFARYVEGVAQAGRAVSPLPFYANAWQGPEPGEPNPGDYPSGGPTAAMLDVWKAGAPTLAMLCPDIYVADSALVQQRYARADNPLFVPEARFRPGDLFLALGTLPSLGQASFGIDSVRPDSRLAESYRLLAPMQDLITAAQADGRIAGFVVQGDAVRTVRLGGYEIAVRDADAFERRLDAGEKNAAKAQAPSETAGEDTPPDSRAFGLVVALDGGRFVFAGQGFMADVTRNGRPAEIDQVQEGSYAGGSWNGGRLLNGDDYGQVVPRDHPGATLVTLMP